MGNLFNYTNFIFNSTGQMENFAGKPFQLFLEENGTIVNKSNIEYGIYNKIINFQFKKVLMIQKHFLGLGDIIDWITKITKLKDLIIYLTKGNCGCEERRIKFNKWFKFYWFSLKFREIYADDLRIIPMQKELLKQIKSKPKENKSLPASIRSNQTNNITPNQKPIKEIKPHRSCGCGAKKNVK